MHRLLVIACSERKAPAAGLLPAIDRYDGPAFRVLRKFLREHESLAPTILVLSAKYGLIPADREIPFYDCRISRDTAYALRPLVVEVAGASLHAKEWRSVGICAGKDYQIALDGIFGLIPPGVRVTLLRGGQGARLSALHKWLRERD
jgi:hypothetical protein